MAQSGGHDQYDHQQMHQNGKNMINSDNENKNAVSEYDAGAGGEAPHKDQAQHHSLAELLQQSGNFSSIDDEPQGGECEKKGLEEKIKEKVPGIGNKEQLPHNTHPPTSGTATGATSGGGYDTHHEKKGIMNKIKDKLPGTH